MSINEPLSENSRRVLRVLRQGGMLRGYSLMGQAALKDAQQLVDALNPLIERGLIIPPAAAFTEDAVLKGIYYIPPSMQGTADFLLNQQPPRLSL